MGQNNNRTSASVSGAGRIAGGVYENVAISGAGKIDGDVQAEQIRISGAGKVNGNVKATEVKVSGACSISGSVEAVRLKASGACRVGGGVQAQELQMSGSSKIGGGVQAETAKMSGAISVAGDVQAERFEAAGAVRIDGLLNAETIEIALHGRSRVREIGGSTIHVCRAEGTGMIFGISFGGQRGRLETETVEGDEVSIEAVQAGVVRGKKVYVGEGCEVSLVEYGESLEMHEDAVVGKVVKTAFGAAPVEEAPSTAVPPAAPTGGQAAAVAAEAPPGRRVGEADFGPDVTIRTRVEARRGGHARLTIHGRQIGHPVARAALGCLGVLIAVGVAAAVVFLLLPLLVTLIGGIFAAVALVVIVAVVYALIHVAVRLIGSFFGAGRKRP